MTERLFHNVHTHVRHIQVEKQNENLSRKLIFLFAAKKSEIDFQMSKLYCTKEHSCIVKAKVDCTHVKEPSSTC